MKNSILNYLLDNNPNKTISKNGIKPEQIDKIFNKFERAEEDMNSTIEGTGLGLAITKSLVEMMGGKNWYIQHMVKGLNLLSY